MSTSSLLHMQGITKEFPGVRALDGVDFTLQPGEIHALLGENGAGKSTLMRILFGVHEPDSGEILVRGQEVVIRSPHDAKMLGISMVHQELNLVPGLNAAQNIALGQEAAHVGGQILDWPTIRAMARQYLAELGVEVDVSVPVKRLSVAQRQMIEIAKALSWQANILVMDEPTSSLTEREIFDLFDALRRLKARGVGIVFITHRLDEIARIADRVTVLRDGRNAGTWPAGQVSMSELIRAMVGRTISAMFPKANAEVGTEALRVEGLSRGKVLRGVSFSAYKGEVLGVAGLVGSGRTELAKAIFGAEPAERGQIFVNGRAVTIRSPQDAIRNGIGLLVEDRKTEGLVLQMSVQSNLVLPLLDRLTRLTIIQRRQVRGVARRFVDDLKIKTPSLDRQVKFLSGGNQQKVVLGKWLARHADILIFDEPTRGIDVGAKIEVHQLIGELARAGACILMISSELPEVVGMSDRVLVMREGQLVAELRPPDITQETIMHHATGTAVEGGTVA